ncbi:hypothetical protein [Hoeflea sp.]|uniref:hypothetical protein n=1 Tax=Hoeflea sp. TaxID=1940281 RepID=UPI003A957EC0
MRAAISGLRKRGHEIVKTKSQKTGGMVYAINAGAKERKLLLRGRHHEPGGKGRGACRYRSL